MNVESLIKKLSKKFELNESYKIIESNDFPESGLLQLDIDKAKKLLRWQPVLNTSEMIESVSDWYFNFFEKNIDLMELTLKQIEIYESKASKKKLPWAIL